MANVYGNRNASTRTAAPAAATSTTGTKSAGVLFRTGLFAPRNENSKAIGTVQLKEDVVLKAGSYINLYENEKKSDTSPIFSMQVREGVLKSK